MNVKDIPNFLPGHTLPPPPEFNIPTINKELDSKIFITIIVYFPPSWIVSNFYPHFKIFHHFYSVLKFNKKRFSELNNGGGHTSCF